MLRLFVAFEVPKAQKDSVQKAIASVAVPGARWTSRESWHVTLKFLGATAEERLAEVTGVVEQAASTSQPARTSLQDLGAFPSFRPERRPWTPHLTVARLKVPAAIALEPGQIHLDEQPFDVRQVVLFRSHLKAGGAVYEPLAGFRLGRPI